VIVTPPIGLSVSPARVALVAPAAKAIEVRNVGAQRVVVDVARKSLDGRGETELLGVRPTHLVLHPGSSRVLTLRAGAARGAGPGDHRLRLLFVARPVGGGRIAVRVRLGVGVRIRVPGRTIRRLVVRGLRVRRHGGARFLLVCVANAGNLTEQLRGQLTLTLIRGGRFVSRLRLRTAREVFPGTHTVVLLRYVGRVRGVVTAVVQLRRGSRELPLERRYRIRL
jgi:hypothetical protein